MNSTLSKVLMFTTGAAVGSLVTWKLVKTKYERIAQEEIDSVKEVYFSGQNQAAPVDWEKEADEENDLVSVSFAKPDIVDYAKMVKDEGYDEASPYVIAPAEYGELDGYDTESLTYYAEDGVLTDDRGNPIEDVDSMVGLDSLNHFGEYEEDSVFVRNDRTLTDYEILMAYDSSPRLEETE